MVGGPLHYCVKFSLIFCVLKVMPTLLAASRRGDKGGISAPLRWNMMFPRLRQFVFFSFDFGTCRCSQDQHAKEKAPMMSWVVACCISVVSLSMMAE